MKFRHANRIWIAALIVAWIFNLMFWKTEPGISMTIAVVLTIATGLLLAFSEGRRPAKSSYVLIALILFFGVMLSVRFQAGTIFTNLMLTLGGLAILAVTLLGGKWVWYSLADYVIKFFLLGFGALINGLRVLVDKKPDSEAPDGPPESAAPPSAWRTRGLPILRGVLLAVPVIALLAALLASADPIFSAGLESVLDVFRLENLDEIILRGVNILIIGYLLAGVYMHALANSQEEKLIGQDKPWLSPFLGIVEAAVILGAVNLLFATFVGVQFRYFFGGQANISLEGFTYAEYARRGFGELVSVAVISLLLFLWLSSITRRATFAHRRIFGGLGIALVALVLVMLVSAYQRLVLYETAYGFSELRTYTHVFMIWLGFLLLATIVLEIIQRQRAFALMLVIAAVGFGVSLNLLNVDAFIVRQNVSLAESGVLLAAPENEDSGRITEQNRQSESRYPLDMQYLTSLSTDAIPEMVMAFQRADLSAHSKERLGAVLACKAAAYDTLEYRPKWVSYHLSKARAVQSLQSVRGQLPQIQADKSGMVEVQGESFFCFPLMGE